MKYESFGSHHSPFWEFEKTFDYRPRKLKMSVGAQEPKNPKTDPTFPKLRFIAFLQHNFQKPVGAWAPTATGGAPAHSK